jgi:hypothetical protein
MKNKLILVVLNLFLWGCVMDQKTGIVVVGNETGLPLLVVKQLKEGLKDSIVFHGQIDGTEYGSGEIKTISVSSYGFRSSPNSEKMYLYVFRSDLIDEFRRDNRITGIVQKCLLDKYSIQLNKVTEKLDTIRIR